MRFAPPARGDVVVLVSPENGIVLLKRVFWRSGAPTWAGLQAAAGGLTRPRLAGRTRRR